jgi:hypothetical protein
MFIDGIHLQNRYFGLFTMLFDVTGNISMAMSDQWNLTKVFESSLF